MLFKAWEKTHLVRVESACSTEALISSPRTQVKSLVQSQCWGEDWWTSEALWSSSLEELVNLSQKKKCSVVVRDIQCRSLYVYPHAQKKSLLFALFLSDFFKDHFFFLTREFLFFWDGFGQMGFETSANHENRGIRVLWNLVLKLWFRSPDQMDTWRLKSQSKAFTRLVLQQLGISEDNRLLYFSTQKPL